MGSSFGPESGVYQGYSFTNGRKLDFIANDRSIRVQLRPQPHLAPLAAMAQHVIYPHVPASVHEEKMTQELIFNWDSRRRLWVLQSETQINYLGLYDSSAIDSESLAQSFVNWLCEQ
jgi:hypothetical protein